MSVAVHKAVSSSSESNMNTNAPRNEKPQVMNLPDKMLLVCHFKLSVIMEWIVTFIMRAC